ncbi:MAG TPA: hypothetical protein VJ989_04185 [Solirubrobacterales bacterium]|nr:hypothetical protein [Solirubrobacterales bacterium]
MSNAMQSKQLKSLVENGSYRPEPALVAQAMLRRRGVRALLMGAPLSAADRTLPAAESRRQAA